MITYLNDPLLFHEGDCHSFVNVNNLYKKDELITLEGGILNLYSAFVKSIDFKHISKNIFCNTPIENINKYLDKRLKENNYLKLRKNIAIYCKKEKIKVETFNNWKDNNIWPFFVLRVISLCEKNNQNILSNLIKNINYFTDVRNRIKFYPPKYINNLLKEKYAYFAGCCLGDGGFSNQNFWLIVDGSSVEERIKDSFIHLNNIKKLIEYLFNLKLNEPSRRDNKIELIVNGKVFGRFLNFYFGAPYGKKKNRIEKPKIFLLSRNESNLYKLFWRGVFDSDGYCNNKNKNLSFSSSTKRFIDECKDDFKRYSIKSKIHFGKSKSYQLHILSKDYKKFALDIGFSHPRKKRALLFNLHEGVSDKYFEGLKKKCKHKQFLDIKRLDNLFLYNLGHMIKDFRVKNELYAKDFEGIWEISKKRIYFLENSSSIKVKDFLKFWEISGKSYEEFLRFLYENKIEFSSYGHSKSKIYLPLKLDEEYKFIFNKLRPYKYEVRLLKRDVKNINKFISLVEKKLNVKVIEKRKGVFSICNEALSKYLLNFFEYKTYWEGLSKEEIMDVEKNLNNIFI